MKLNVCPICAVLDFETECPETECPVPRSIDQNLEYSFDESIAHFEAILAYRASKEGRKQ